MFVVLGFRGIGGDCIGGDDSGVIAKSRAGTTVGVLRVVLLTQAGIPWLVLQYSGG